MSKTKIITLSLNEFEKRFKHPESLLRVTGKEVRKFDKTYSPYKCGSKTYSLELNNYLLRNKKWYYVKEYDTYYNKPRKGGFIWFHNHSKRYKVTTACAAAAVVVACAVAAPLITLHYIDAAQEAAKKWYLRRNWYEYTSEASEEELGVECKIKVNGLDHKVRLIDVDKDVDENGNKVHTTWEFSNLLSDSNGHSLAYQWNDTNNSATANHDYINSTLRKALTGEGNATQFLVAQKGETTWSSTYSNKTVISMIPNNIKRQFKKVKKSVGVKVGDKYEQKEYITNLFILSGHNLCNSYDTDDDVGENVEYSYYSNAKKKEELQKARIINQINDTEIYAPDTVPEIPNGKGQIYQGSIKNYAGFTEKLNDNIYGWRWTSSPKGIDKTYSSYDNKYAWLYYKKDGKVGLVIPENKDGKEEYKLAFPIAPAFCI